MKISLSPILEKLGLKDLEINSPEEEDRLKKELKTLFKQLEAKEKADGLKNQTS